MTKEPANEPDMPERADIEAFEPLNLECALPLATSAPLITALRTTQEDEDETLPH